MFGSSSPRAAATCLLLLASSVVLAQNNTGRISGTISDSSGAVIPGARITATNQATQVPAKATTDNNGFFVIPNLQVGALADASADGDNPDSGLGYQNRHYFYGPTTFDRRHILVVTYTYRIPLFRKSHGLVGGAFGRWELSGITRAQSGSPLTPVGSATGITRRADYVGGEVAVASPDPNHWFNTAAFKTAPATALGNAGVGMVRGPGLYLWDLSVRKEFRIGERCRFRLEGQSFNLLNHPNFRSLDVTTSDAAFGTVSGSGPARNIQFAGRLSF